MRGISASGGKPDVIHIGHMLLFAAIVSVFFAFLQARSGRRLRYGAILWLVLVGSGLAINLLMFPFT